MPKLIFHVGPGKCGSSSIQGFFGAGNPCTQNVRYRLLDPVRLMELDCERPSKSALGHFAEILKNDVAECDVLILSHEVLFKRPGAIRHICRLANGMFPTIVVVGYSRRQSEFVFSAYSQWFFRSPERIKETAEVVIGLGLDPMLFSGLERQSIASIANDFYSARQLDGKSILDWHDGYQKLSASVTGLGVEIICGVLPGKESAELLIGDFCEKCGLTLREDAEAASRQVANTSFSREIVEAIDNAIVLGLAAPTPHQLNQTLQLLSATATSDASEPSTFLQALKSYIDGHYWQSNRQLCREYALNEDYFAPSSQLSKEEILDIIACEGQRRASDKSEVIARYRTLSAKMAELCLKLTRKL